MNQIKQLNHQEMLRAEITNRLIEACAAAGHRNWLLTQKNKVFAFPNKVIFNDQQTRTGLLPYPTMKFLQGLVKEMDGEIYVNVDPQEFLDQLLSDIDADPELDFLKREDNLAFISNLVALANMGDPESIETFQLFMKEIATKRIHDNDAYGKAAVRYLSELGYDLLDLENELPQDLKEKLKKIEQDIERLNSMSDPSDVLDLVVMNYALQRLMISSHAVWREIDDNEARSKFINDYSLEITAENIDEVLKILNEEELRLMLDPQSDPDDIITIINQKMRLLHIRPNEEGEVMRPIKSFLHVLLANIHELIDRINNLDLSTQNGDKSSRQYKAVLDDLMYQLKNDANPAIVQGIRAAFEK